MQPLRILLARYRPLAMMIIAAALVLKAVLPSGFMIASAPDRLLTITVCSETTGGMKQMQIAVPQRHDTSGATDTAKKDGHCAFSGHAQDMLGGADAVLLAAALAFILLLGFAPIRQVALRRLHHLRPPPCGPPLTA